MSWFFVQLLPGTPGAIEDYGQFVALAGPATDAIPEPVTTTLSLMALTALGYTTKRRQAT